MEPNRENIRKWIEGLRSGKFEQAVGALRKGDGRCCLGVACEVAIENGLKVSVLANGDGEWFYDGDHVSLPGTVSQWLGLVSEDEYGQPTFTHDPMLVVRGSSEPKSATVLNDQHKKSFNEIADAIEYTYLGPIRGGTILSKLDSLTEKK